MAKICDGIIVAGNILCVILKVLYYIFEAIILAVCKLFIPTKKKNVAGEIVLITGAGHGIGKELAIGYASLGATVVCWDINEENNKQTMNDIKKMGYHSVYAYKCDIRDKEEIFKVAEEVRKEVGDVTILINNAGIVYVKTFLCQSVDEITSIVNVNMIAHYWMSWAFLPNMIKKNHGHIVAVSSLLAFVNISYWMIYCVTKSSVKGFMEALSEELRACSKGKSSIKFTTVYPAAVLSGFAKISESRLPIIMRGLSPQKAASLIIDAQRRDFKERSIPSHWLPIFKLSRFVPDKVLRCLIDFIDMNSYLD